MKYTLSIVAVSIAFLLDKCDSFQVEPDGAKILKKAIETSVEHPIKKQIGTDDAQPLPMITVYDDDSYSPFTPFMSSVTNLFRAKSSLEDEQHSRPRPLFESMNCDLIERVSPTKRAVPRKTFGLDDHPSEYWFNNRIHSFGNTGFLGAFHAAVAPLATTMIDVLAYEKRDVRAKVGSLLRNTIINKSKARVLDLCCGVGISTRALSSAFYDAETVIGIDTSPEMIATARSWLRHESAHNYMNAMFNRTIALDKNSEETSLDERNIMFARGNAERTIFPDSSFDLVTIMYGFHEIPKLGRYRILREVRRLLRDGGTLALVDICPEYEPSPSMLFGEPYVLEYQRNIHSQMRKIQGFTDLEYKVIIPGHVGLWLLTRKTSSSSVQTSSIFDKKLPF